MRFGMVLGIAGFVLCSGLPAMAQNYQTQQAPLYVPPQSNSNYYATDQGGVPFYNNSANPIPMEQMVAGKNAPSYNYNNASGAQPYTFNAPKSYSSGMALTPESAAQIRAARDQQAQQYQADYMRRLAESENPTIQQGTNLYNNLRPQEEKPKPTKRRVVYRENDNPLRAPPRLFNPDQ